MTTALIRFPNRTSEADGLVELARRTRVDALPEGLYRVRNADLVILEENGIEYSFAATNADSEAAEGERHTAAAEV